MLNLTSLIRQSGVHVGNFKIHCATGKLNRKTGHDNRPINAFHGGTWKEWQERQNQKNFECEQVLSLIYVGKSRWLFAGLFNVLGVKKGHPENPDGYIYSTEEIAGLEHLTGRAIVKFEKNFRQSYLVGKKHEEDLVIAALLEERIAFREFHGFNNVLLSFEELQIVIRDALPTWKSSLSRVDGIYVIADKMTGKLYVGIAHGGEGIWQRWSEYAKNGHGNNDKLKKLLLSKGVDYARNFQFSILEVCHLHEDEESIHQKERHWMAVLGSRQFGYNS